MKMRKIVAILAAVLMLFSILPISAFAADEETITVTGSTGVLDGTASISWDGTNYQVVNYKDNSSTAIRTSDSTHFRVYVGNEFYVQGKDGALMSQVVINCVSSYLINNSANTVSEGWTVAANGTVITYTATSGAASELHISIGKQSRVTSVVITPGSAGSADCDHENLVCGDTCPECEEYVKEHKFSNNCVAVCENGCGTANPDYADHVYDGIYDAICNVCSAAREVNFPEADSELTIPEADAIGLGMSHDTTTPGKYYVTGVVESIVNTTYGNLYIQDENGNKLYVYGTYDADGTNRFDAMAEQPEVGVTITVYGVIGNYNAASQMKNGWITAIVGGCEHQYDFECSTTCNICGKGVRDVVCETDAEYECQDGLCIYCGNDVIGLGHAFDDQYDPDCNYGCGETREVEERPELTEATLDFSTTDQRTEYSNSIQKWENGTLVLTNNKGGSTSNVGDYYKPARFYKGSEVIIAFPGMTSLVIDAAGVGSKYVWTATLDAAGVSYTDADGVYTITFAEPVDSVTFTTAAQIRANSITATAAKQSGGDEPECEHSWNPATCTEPATCALCGAQDGAALGHNYVADIIDATCTAAGSTTYECSICFDSYDEIIPMKPHNYVDGICSACGAELPLEATITFDADKTQRTEFSTTTQKWENEGLVLINNKAGSTNSVADYSNPVRLYKGSEIIISFPAMTSLVIDGPTSGDYAWTATLDAAGLTYTAADGIYTITFAEPTDSITLTAANQVRANSITASRVQSEPACEHVYDNACDVDCNLCYETREVSHNVLHVEAKDATCFENGNIEYWYCDVCGAAWLDAECIMNTNLRAVVLPAIGEHTYDDDYDADCNVCGDVREVPEKPVEIAYGDANGDGTINIRDVALLQQYITGWEVTLNEANADANGDGTINIRDVALLQQYITGWDVTLGPTKLYNDGVLGGW